MKCETMYILPVLLVLLLGSAICAPVDHALTKRGVMKDAIIGAVGGALIGALVPGMDAKQGAAAGAAVGAGYGYYQDRKQKKTQKQGAVPAAEQHTGSGQFNDRDY